MMKVTKTDIVLPYAALIVICLGNIVAGYLRDSTSMMLVGSVGALVWVALLVSVFRRNARQGDL